MPSTTKKLEDKGFIHPPTWLSSNVHYETIMGSVAYGVSSDTSDMDVYGWCIPSKSLVFPHLAGEILGFGRQLKRFEQFQQHHINCPDELGGKGRVYDLSIYNIVRYFQLCLENNPNMLDSLFTSQECILHITQVGNMVREKRHKFLHKGCWFKLKGYSYSQLHMTDTKRKDEHFQKVTEIEEQYKIPHSVTFDLVQAEAELRGACIHEGIWVSDEAAKSKGVDGTNPLFTNINNMDFRQYYIHYKAGMEKTTRFQALKSAGTDLKFLYHVVRLLDEAEQILTSGDLDLRRNKEQLKAIRRGDMPEAEVRRWAADKEKQLEALYHSDKCPVPHSPPEEEIKELLLSCLEHHYGSLENCVVREDAAIRALREVAEVIDRNRRILG